MTFSANAGARVGSSRCRACGADLPDGAATCPRCGTSQTMSTCPHCGGTAGVSPDKEMRFKCDLCGGPRIPFLAPAIRTSGKEVSALKAAEYARKGRAAGRATAIAGGVGLSFTVLAFAIFWLIFGLGIPSAIAFLVLAGPFGALLAWGSQKATTRGKEIPPALDAAWLAAASDVAAQSRGQLTAHDLAVALGIDEARAEELLAMVDVHRAMGGGAGLPRSDAMAAFDAKLRVATDAAGNQGSAQEAAREAAAEDEAAQAEANARARARREREP